jgi:hypothetical protein
MTTFSLPAVRRLARPVLRKGEWESLPAASFLVDLNSSGWITLVIFHYLEDNQVIFENLAGKRGDSGRARGLFFVNYKKLTATHEKKCTACRNRNLRTAIGFYDPSTPDLSACALISAADA